MRGGEKTLHFKNVTGFDPRSGPISAPPFTSYLNSIWKTGNKTIFLRILHNNLYNTPSIVSCDQEVTSPGCTHDSESQIHNVYSFVFSLLEESVHWALKKQLDIFSIKLVMQSCHFDFWACHKPFSSRSLLPSSRELKQWSLSGLTVSILSPWSNPILSEPLELSLLKSGW